MECRSTINMVDMNAALGSAEAIYYLDIITVHKTESAQSVYRLNINFQISMGMRLQPVFNQNSHDTAKPVGYCF